MSREGAGQYCGRCSAEVERRRGGRGVARLGGVTGSGSGLGHGTGLLVIDVAAHAAGVHAWRDHRGAAEVRGGVIDKGVGGCLGLSLRGGKHEKAQQKQGEVAQCL